MRAVLRFLGLVLLLTGSVLPRQILARDIGLELLRQELRLRSGQQTRCFDRT